MMLEQCVQQISYQLMREVQCLLHLLIHNARKSKKKFSIIKKMLIQYETYRNLKLTLPIPVSEPPCPGRGIFISITFPNLEHSSRTSSNISNKFKKN